MRGRGVVRFLTTNREAPGAPREYITFHSYRISVDGDLLSPLLLGPFMETVIKTTRLTGGSSDNKPSGTTRRKLKKL